MDEWAHLKYLKEYSHCSNQLTEVSETNPRSPGDFYLSFGEICRQGLLQIFLSLLFDAILSSLTCGVYSCI